MKITDTTPCLEVYLDEETGHAARLIVDREGELFGEPGRYWIAYRLGHGNGEDITEFSAHRTRKSVKAFLRGIRQARMRKAA
jgi:hypothetical protein